MKTLLPLVLLLASPSCFAAHSDARNDICGYRTLYDGTVFTLTIGRSFDPWVQFKLCERKDPEKNFILVSKKPKPGKIIQHKIQVKPETYRSLIGLYNKALNYNVKDPTMGLDGSSWCLETTRGFTYSKACFWTPSYKAKERGLTGLVELGKALWRLGTMRKKVGKLY